MSDAIPHRSTWRQKSTRFLGVVTRQFPVVGMRPTRVVQVRLQISSADVVLRFERGTFLRMFERA